MQLPSDGFSLHSVTFLREITALTGLIRPEATFCCEYISQWVVKGGNSLKNKTFTFMYVTYQISLPFITTMNVLKHVK